MRGSLGPMVLALVCGGVLLAGCSSEAPGIPAPTSPVLTEGTESGAERPADVQVAGVDPCSLVKQSVLNEYGVTSPGKRRDRTEFEAPGCIYVTEYGGVSVYVSPTQGVEVWPAREREGVRVQSERDVVGFPAIRVEQDAAGACITVVDTGDKESVIGYALVNSSEPEKVGHRCEYSYQVAEAAMTTLLGG